MNSVVIRQNTFAGGDSFFLRSTLEAEVPVGDPPLFPVWFVAVRCFAEVLEIYLAQISKFRRAHILFAIDQMRRHSETLDAVWRSLFHRVPTTVIKATLTSQQAAPPRERSASNSSSVAARFPHRGPLCRFFSVCEKRLRVSRDSPVARLPGRSKFRAASDHLDNAAAVPDHLVTVCPKTIRKLCPSTSKLFLAGL